MLLNSSPCTWSLARIQFRWLAFRKFVCEGACSIQEETFFADYFRDTHEDACDLLRFAGPAQFTAAWAPELPTGAKGARQELPFSRSPDSFWSKSKSQDAQAAMGRPIGVRTETKNTAMLGIEHSSSHQSVLNATTRLKRLGD